MTGKNLNYAKYEKARMVGSRALQLSMGAPFLLKLTDDDLKKINYNLVKIALMEFENGIIPITIKRHLPLKPQ